MYSFLIFGIKIEEWQKDLKLPPGVFLIVAGSGYIQKYRYYLSVIKETNEIKNIPNVEGLEKFMNDNGLGGKDINIYSDFRCD